MDFAQKPDCAELKLTQTGVPKSDYDRTKEGWKNYYWRSINMTFGFGARLFWCRQGLHWCNDAIPWLYRLDYLMNCDFFYYFCEWAIFCLLKSIHYLRRAWPYNLLHSEGVCWFLIQSVCEWFIAGDMIHYDRLLIKFDMTDLVEQNYYSGWVMQ